MRILLVVYDNNHIFIVFPLESRILLRRCSKKVLT